MASTAGQQFNKERAWRKNPKKDLVDFNGNEIKSEPAKINTEGQECEFCHFKAQYKFLRCPECEKERR